MSTTYVGEWKCKFGFHVWGRWGYLPIRCQRCGIYATTTTKEVL